MWLIYALLAAVTWGLNYTLDEQVFKHDVSPITLLAGQSLFGAIVFSVAAYFYRLKPDLAIIASQRNLLWLVIFALLAANVGNLFITLSIQAKNATLAAIIEESYPIFTLLFAYILFKENQFSLSVGIGGALILAGVVIISVFNK